MPNLYIIAGCNGAGKTTASFTILPEMLDCYEFVNADEIAVHEIDQGFRVALPIRIERLLLFDQITGQIQRGPRGPIGGQLLILKEVQPEFAFARESQANAST